MIGIYKLSWDSGFFYYGQSINIENRISRHICLLKKKRHENYKLQKCFNLYGYPTVSIVKECFKNELTKFEDIYISKNYENGNCCNLSMASNSCLKRQVSNDYKLKKSIFMKQWWADENNKNKRINSMKGMNSGSNNPAAIRVMNKNTGEIFYTLKEAAESQGIKLNTLSQRITRNKEKVFIKVTLM